MEPVTGCYIDSHNGHYLSALTIQLAESFGWEDQDAIQLATKYFEDPYDSACEFIHDAADDAVEWLNTNIAEPEHSFGFYEGELMYWHTSQWEEQ
jgi:hypothetical protein